MERICLQCKRPKFNNWVRKIPWKKAQHSYLENSMDSRVHGVAKTWTQLND